MSKYIKYLRMDNNTKSIECAETFSEKREGRKVIDARSRLLISNLRDYFAKERDKLAPAYPPEDPVGRTACALKLNPETVSAVIKGEMYNKTSDSDSNCDEEEKDKTIGFPGMDCFKMEEIRQVIHSFMLKSEPITSLKLRRALKKRNISIRLRELSCILRRLGFCFKEYLQAKILFERNDFVAKRCKFLRTMVQVNLKKVIWIGESCIYSTCVNKVPYSRKRGSISKGGRVIILHAGGYNGWIQGAERIVISKKTNDYREDIGTKCFHEWFESLLKLIPGESIIVMENNLCHLVEVDKPPKENNSREDILDWLGRHNVWLDNDGEDFSKAELLGLVAETQSFYPTYKANEAAAKLGHTVIHLPLEHSHFNPIERIYQQVLTAVDKRADSMGGLSLNDLESQVYRAISNVTQRAWAETVMQCNHTISKYWAQEPKLQDAVETLLQNILTHKKTGRVCITQEGNIENFIISEEGSDSDHHSTTHTKRIKITDPDPIEMDKILRKEESQREKQSSEEIIQSNKHNKKSGKYVETCYPRKIQPLLESDGITGKTVYKVIKNTGHSIYKDITSLVDIKGNPIIEDGSNTGNLLFKTMPNTINIYKVLPNTTNLVCQSINGVDSSIDSCSQKTTCEVICNKTPINKGNPVRQKTSKNYELETKMIRSNPSIIRKQFDLLPKYFLARNGVVESLSNPSLESFEGKNRISSDSVKTTLEEYDLSDNEEATVRHMEVVTDIPDIQPSEDMGLFQISIASEDSLSDVPDLNY